jgi:hypothetical protein
MSFDLTVEWNNAGSNLLKNALGPIVTVKESGTTFTGNGTNGAQSFTLAGGAPVDVTAHFAPRPGIELEVVQRLVWDGATLTPDTYDTLAQSGLLGRHPLVAVRMGSNARGATATVSVRADFVDITERWRSAHVDAKRPGWDWDAQDHHNVELAVLGHTGGAPVVWFASLPPSCRNGGRCSALVFFRPNAHYSYDVPNDHLGSIDNPAHDLNGVMSTLGRYLLDPACGGKPGARAAVQPPLREDHWHPDPPGLPFNGVHPAGFERALGQNDKPVALLQPWPNNVSFGAVTGRDLIELSRRALFTLHTRDKVVKGSFRIMDRFGMAAYSAGGTDFWPTLDNLLRRRLGPQIHEIWSFQSNDFHSRRSLLTSRVQQGPDVQIRIIVSGEGFAAHPFANAKNHTFHAWEVKGPIDNLKQKDVTVTVHPDLDASKGGNPDFFKFQPNPRGSFWWQHVLSEVGVSDSRGDPLPFFTKPQSDGDSSQDRIQHQFAIFGGEASGPAPTFYGETYLGMCIRRSRF